MSKKWISLLILIVMLVSVIPAGNTEGIIEYETDTYTSETAELPEESTDSTEENIGLLGNMAEDHEQLADLTDQDVITDGSLQTEIAVDETITSVPQTETGDELADDHPNAPDENKAEEVSAISSDNQTTALLEQLTEEEQLVTENEEEQLVTEDEEEQLVTEDEEEQLVTEDEEERLVTKDEEEQLVTEDEEEQLVTEDEEEEVVAAAGISITTQPQNTYAPLDSTVIFRIEVTGIAASYQWQNSLDGTSWRNSSLSGNKTTELFVPVTNTRYKYQWRCAVTDAAGRVKTSNAVCILKPVIDITAQPADVVAQPGDVVAFCVNATGAELKYQWQNSPDGVTWSATSLEGGRTTTLLVPVTATRCKYQWRCVITDSFGNRKESTVVSIVYAPLKIATQPVSVIAAWGETIQFSISATGIGLKYQWQNSPDGVNWNATALTGGRTDTLTVPVTSTRAKYQWRCVVTDVYGNTKESTSAHITIPTINIEKQPASVTAGVGETIQFAVTADGIALKYQWQNSLDGENWSSTSLEGCRTATLTVPVTTARGKYQWRCVITDVYGNTKESRSAHITIATINIKKQPASVTARVGETIQFAVTADGIDLKYQWQNSPDGENWSSTSLEGRRTATLTVPVTTARGKYQWRCVITDPYGNREVTKAVKLTVPVITITSQPEDQRLNGNQVILTVNAEGLSLRYQWQYSADGTTWTRSSQSGYNTATLTLPGTANVAKYKWRCVISDPYGNEKATRTVRITLPIVRIVGQPSDVIAKAGDTVQFLVEADGINLSYQWQYSKDAVSWSNSGLTGAKTACLRVPVTEARCACYWRCVVSCGTANRAVSDSVRIVSTDIIIKQQPDSVVAKAGDKVSFSVQAIGTGLKYQWQYSKDGTQWNNTSLAGSTTDTLTLTASATWAGYKWHCVITNTYGSKAVTSAASLSLAEISISQHPQSVTVYENNSASFTVKASGSGLQYQWQYSTNGTNWNSIGQNSASLTVTATLSTTANKFRCVITDNYGNKVTTRTAVLTVQKRNLVQYDVPLYNQHGYYLCWAFCQVMVEDWEKGITRTNESATARAIEIAKSVVDEGEEWNKGGWPTNTNYPKSSSRIDNPTMSQLYTSLTERGPIYAYYCSPDNTSAHLVVVTGADKDNNTVYINNPQGVQGSQTYREFVDGYYGQPASVTKKM